MNEKISTSLWGGTKEIEPYFEKAVSKENYDCYLIWVPKKKNFVHCLYMQGSESIAYEHIWQI